MRLSKHTAFISDSYDNKRILLKVREVDNGFNLKFHCRKKDIDVNPYSNIIVLTYKKNSMHTDHMVHMSVELYNGVLNDVSMDEVEEERDYYTIMRIRMVGYDRMLEDKRGWLGC